jgi:hypothetical protein
MIIIKGNKIRTKFEEISIGEFSKIFSNPNPKEGLDFWINALIVLGVPEEEVDEFTPSDIYELSKEFCNTPPEHKIYPDNITVDDVTYGIKKEGAFKIPLRVFSKLEEDIRIYQTVDFLKACALCLRTPGLSLKEDIESHHVEAKMEKISSLPCSDFMEIIVGVMNDLLEKTSFLSNGHLEETKK